jgi:hypothetical protein
MRLKESTLRAGMSMLTPPLLLAIAWGAFVVDAPPLLTVAVVIVAVVLGYTVLFDFPLSIDLDDEGIHRNSLLRRQSLHWDQIEGIVKVRRKGLMAVTKSGKKLILLDRTLKDSEVELLETKAQHRDVKTGLRKG